MVHRPPGSIHKTLSFLGHLRSCNKPAAKPALLPNLGGSLPNDVFADTLGLPTLWIPTPIRPVVNTGSMSIC